MRKLNASISTPAEFQRVTKLRNETQDSHLLAETQSLGPQRQHPAEFQRGCRVDRNIAEMVTRSVRIFLVSVHSAPPAVLVREVC